MSIQTSTTVALLQIKIITKKGALHYLDDDFESGYSELLQKSKITAMTTQRLGSLCNEIYKTLNQLNPGLMSKIFKLSASNSAACKQQVLNLETMRPNHFNFPKEN